MNRFEIIDYLKDSGYNYNFDKYSDSQLYRIYQKSIDRVSPKEIAKMQREFSKEQPRETCEICGAYLDSVGDCPVCDHGEEDYFESEIYFENVKLNEVNNMGTNYDIEEFVKRFNEFSNDWAAIIEDDYVTFYIQEGIGEDYFEEIEIPDNLDALLNDIWNRYDNFDPDEHAEELAKYRAEGAQGIPGIRQLIHEADIIDEALSNMYTDADKVISEMLKESEDDYLEESLSDDVDDVEVAIRDYFKEYDSSVSEEDINDLSSEVFDFFENTDNERHYDEVEELVDAFIEEKADETTIRLIRTIRDY